MDISAAYSLFVDEKRFKYTISNDDKKILTGAVVEIDDKTKKTISIERIMYED